MQAKRLLQTFNLPEKRLESKEMLIADNGEDIVTFIIQVSEVEILIWILQSYNYSRQDWSNFC